MKDRHRLHIVSEERLVKRERQTQAAHQVELDLAGKGTGVGIQCYQNPTEALVCIHAHVYMQKGNTYNYNLHGPERNVNFSTFILRLCQMALNDMVAIATFPPDPLSVQGKSLLRVKLINSNGNTDTNTSS